MEVSPTSLNRTILQNTRHTIDTHGLFETGESVLVAVSGGADSICLLHVLLALAPEYGLRLGVAHLHHGLRGEAADRDARFVADLARRCNLPVFLGTADVRGLKQQRRLCLEEAARHARYDFLAHIARQHHFSKIAVGHQQDDNVELTLMFLIRGSGARGAGGIPPVRENRIVRPLIDTKREDILSYLKANGLDCISDATNQDNVFLRNRIRLQLLPALAKDYNPRIREALARFARVTRAEDDWLESLTAPILKAVCLAQSDTSMTLSVEALRSLHPAAQRRVLRGCLETVKGSLRRITFEHIEAVLALASNGARRGSLDLPDRIRVQRSPDRLQVSLAQKPLRTLTPDSPVAPTKDFNYPVPDPVSETVSIALPEIRGRLEFRRISSEKVPTTRHAGGFVAFFAIDALSFPLTIRNVRPGDRFTPFGMAGRQKVHRFFIKQKIPRESRIRYPLLLSGTKIIWVAGLRMDQTARLTPGTRRVLRGELLLA
ncbi:MAG: tRNA lysidine(34) synthetase TilS [Desulfobacterales bacterium]